MKRRIFLLFSFVMMALGLGAQSLVFHYCGGGEAVVPLPASWNFSDGKLVVSGGGEIVEINKSEVLTVSYRGKQGDVNGDERVDIGDVSTILKLIADSSEDEMGHAPAGVEAVDLGLPSGTKWANMNVGAEKPEDYGDYFAWGETKPKVLYSWETYIHCGGSAEAIHDIGADIAGNKDYDAATANWGGSWRIPTLEQFKELINNCTSEWTTQNGVDGRKFTGPNGSIIFLPAAGFIWGSNFGYVNLGNLWSSTHFDGDPLYAGCLSFDWEGVNASRSGRSIGCSVRPVR